MAAGSRCGRGRRVRWHPRTRALDRLLEQAAPHGAHEFPVGTIIVKESQQADAGQRVVFAMVKRQARTGDYNTDGAKGWEWWSLQDMGDCSMSQLWRGPLAPAVESYAGTPTGDCNGCHAQEADNDYVWDEALQLSKF